MKSDIKSTKQMNLPPMDKMLSIRHNVDRLYIKKKIGRKRIMLILRWTGLSKDRLRISKIWMKRKIEAANNSIYISENKLQKLQMEWDEKEVGET